MTKKDRCGERLYKNMKILLGTKSKNKLSILKEYLGDHSRYSVEVIDAKSEIADQPLDLKTTKAGAINRARNSIRISNKFLEGDLSIGMEGGLVMVEGIYNLVCVTTIIDINERVHVGLSDYISLPKEVSIEIEYGGEFGKLIREFENKQRDRNNVEFINRTEELISRKMSFIKSLDNAFNKVKYDDENRNQ